MAKISELVAKLIAHEASARKIGSIAEAEAFAVKIAELSVKFTESNTSDSEVPTEDQSGIGTSGLPRDRWEGLTVSSATKKEVWMHDLTSAIARTMACKVVMYGQHVTIVGFADNRAAVAAAVMHLAKVGLDLAKAEFKYPANNIGPNGRKMDSLDRTRYRRQWIRSYMAGYVWGIAERTQVTTALVPKDSPVDEYVNSLTEGRTRRAVGQHTVMGAAWSGGMQSGSKVGPAARGMLR